jgi:hypothetical protein
VAGVFIQTLKAFLRGNFSAIPLASGEVMLISAGAHGVCFLTRIGRFAIPFGVEALELDDIFATNVTVTALRDAGENVEFRGVTEGLERAVYRIWPGLDVTTTIGKMTPAFKRWLQDMEPATVNVAPYVSRLKINLLEFVNEATLMANGSADCPGRLANREFFEIAGLYGRVDARLGYCVIGSGGTPDISDLLARLEPVAARPVAEDDAGPPLPEARAAIEVADNSSDDDDAEESPADAALLPRGATPHDPSLVRKHAGPCEAPGVIDAGNLVRNTLGFSALSKFHKFQVALDIVAGKREIVSSVGLICCSQTLVYNRVPSQVEISNMIGAFPKTISDAMRLVLKTGFPFFPDHRPHLNGVDMLVERRLIARRIFATGNTRIILAWAERVRILDENIDSVLGKQSKERVLTVLAGRIAFGLLHPDAVGPAGEVSARSLADWLDAIENVRHVPQGTVGHYLELLPAALRVK